MDKEHLSMDGDKPVSGTHPVALQLHVYLATPSCL